MESADPIDVDEAESQLRYVQRALAADSDAERRAALADGMLAFGVRFMHTLGYLVEAEDAKGAASMFAPLAEEASELFARWLTGAGITDRADEDERRAVVAAELAEQTPALGAIGAKAILALPEGHPHRSVDRARALLERYVEVRGEDPENELRAINLLVGIGVDDAELETLLARGSELQPDVDDDVIRNGFAIAAAGACLVRAIEARDEEEDVAAQHAWVERGVRALGTDELAASVLPLLAALYSVADDERGAAETFARASAAAGAGDDVNLAAVMFEARFRYGLGEHERVVELLGSQLGAYEELYLTAVSAEAIEAAGTNLGDAVINLAFALGQLGRWSDALGVLDRGRSLRARYRAALRLSDAGTQLLALERDLYRLERGVGGALEPAPARDEDRLAPALLPRTRLLEAYRRLRPQLPAATIEGPSVSALAGVLAADEAAVLLGATSSEVLLAGIVAGDDAAPSVARVVAFAIERWTDALAGEGGEGWLSSIESGAPHGQVAAALAAFVALAGEALGALPAELAARGVRRLVVVPHRWLHLVPWWAVPELGGFELIQTAACAADLVAARRAATPVLGRRALVVANPTGDLRAAPAEAAAVDRRLAALGIACTRLDGPAATEEAVIGAMREGPGILHFCGHGQSDLGSPERSALLLHPHVDPAAGDPFAAWTAAVAAWDEHDGGRAGEVPGVGRLMEDDTNRGRERRLEHGPTGTLWGQYDGDRLVRLAELWTAGDMLVGDALDGCALAVLSACESGSGALGLDKIDEAAGLPAAMRLAGAATVVGTMWPVGDALGALFVDMFYAHLAEYRGGDVDLAGLVHRTREDLRALGREAAVAGIDALRRATADPIARFTLEAFGAEVAAGPSLPFADAYDWAPFFTIGTARARLPAEAPA